MFLNFVLASFTFLAIASFSVWALRGVGTPIESRIRALALSRQRGEGSNALPFQQRLVLPVVESIGKGAAALLPGAFLRRTEHRLVLAGQPMGASSFYTLMFGTGALLAGLYFVLIFAGSGGTPSAVALLPGVLLGFLGVYIVSFWLSTQAKSRQTAMLRGLPDSLDLLTICVEAGLGLDAALHRVTEKQSGPIVDEIRHMLREIGLGKTRRQGLLDLADRTDLDDVRSFTNAVIQAEQLGTSLAQVLRVQSQRMRIRRRQRAEQEARRAPVKMAFPLVFCLMPSLFIFILGPIVVNLINYLSD